MTFDPKSVEVDDDLSTKDESESDVESSDIVEEEKPTSLPEPSEGELPSWAELPPGMVLPRKPIAVMRFRAAWTETPEKGDRTCVLWTLNVGDERLAAQRAMGDPMRVIGEMSKQCIRAIDGVKADWSGRKGLGDVNKWWDEIGAKCRAQIQNYYLKTHALNDEEKVDFFFNCIDIKTPIST